MGRVGLDNSEDGITCCVMYESVIDVNGVKSERHGIPSASICCMTIPKYILPTHSGPLKDESRLYQWPDPESSDGPKRRNVNQCCLRLRMKASWFLEFGSYQHRKGKRKRSCLLRIVMEWAHLFASPSYSTGMDQSCPGSKNMDSSVLQIPYL